MLHGQFPQPVFDTILSAADVVALPYEAGAQSGIMAHCFAFRKPVVTSDRPAFVKWLSESGGGLAAGSDEELCGHIIRLLQDDDYRQSLRDNIGRFVTERASWRVVAGRHRDVYERIAWKPTPAARHFG